MKKNTKRGLFIVVLVIVLFSWLGKEQGVAGMFLGLAVFIWIANWAFDAFMPEFMVRSKKKLLKKLF